MVATFGFDQFTSVRVLVNLDHASAALFWCGNGSSTGLARVWIKDGNDVAQAFAIGLHQGLKLFFEFDFFLQAGVVLQGFQLGKLFLKGFFCCALRRRPMNCNGRWVPMNSFRISNRSYAVIPVSGPVAKY